MKNELIIFAAAIALLAGCSKEEGAPAAERPCIRLSTGVEAAHARDGCRIRRGRQLRPHRPQPHERDSTVARRRTLPEQWFVYANSGGRRNADSQIPREIGRFLRLLSLPRGVYRGEQFHVHRAERPERRPQLHEQRPDERRTAECCPDGRCRRTDLFAPAHTARHRADARRRIRCGG